MKTSSHPAGRSEVFRFGEFTFDCGSHLLRRDDEEQHLSRKAQQLLRMLLLSHPKAISREEIYDALWPQTYVCETNMASIVSELRRALCDDARSAQYIRTIHGYGYAFTADVNTSDAKPAFIGMLLCEGQRHLLYEGRNVIGRSQDCDVVLNGATVSRRHAIITMRRDTIVVEDTGSRNGTYVKDQRVTRAEIRHQDPLTFGAVPAVISRRISSTMPIPLNFREPRSHSSGSIAPS